MRRHFVGMICAMVLVAFIIISWRTEDAKKMGGKNSTPVVVNDIFESYLNNLYLAIHVKETGLGLDVFKKAYIGFMNLKTADKLPANSSMLTVIDFNKPSREKRMWIIDTKNDSLILNTWVAHGSGSGSDSAMRFSDNNDSHESSLGFYLTDNVYVGKHGRSLKLDGLDEGFNTNARMREIVVHAASYVSSGTISKLGRIGCSFGCPAVSPEVSDFVINKIKGKNVLFINGRDQSYSSKYLDTENLPLNFFRTDSSQVNIANNDLTPVKKFINIGKI